MRTIDKASVKLRFRIMTEVSAEGNILNSTQYPKIIDNSINLIVPIHTEEDNILSEKKFATTFDNNEKSNFNIFQIKHHLNGYFKIFQTALY